MYKHELLNLRGLVRKPTIFLLFISYILLVTAYFAPNFIFPGSDFQQSINHPVQSVLDSVTQELRSLCGFVLTYE